MFSKVLFDCNHLLKDYRLLLMGIAMICIILFHQHWLTGGMFDVMHECGHWGVDIFLVISGFGIGYSLNHHCLRVFYKNRIKRLLPICVLMGCISLLLIVLGLKNMPRMLFLYLMPFSLHEWYICAILIYYTIAPLVKMYTERYGMLFLVVVIIACFFAKSFDLSYLWPIDWAIERFPAFCFGIWVYTRKKLSFNVCHLFGMLGGVILLSLLLRYNVLIWNSRTYLYILFLPIIPLVCYLSVILCNAINQVCIKPKMAIEWIGKYSLEIYLAHELIFGMIKNPVMGNLPTFLMAVTCSLILARLCNFFIGIILQRVHTTK